MTAIIVAAKSTNSGDDDDDNDEEDEDTPPLDSRDLPLSVQPPLFSRPVRNCTLAERARLAAERKSGDKQREALRVHFRKRRTFAPTEAVKKRQKCEAIALCAWHTH